VKKQEKNMLTTPLVKYIIGIRMGVGV